MRLPYNSEMEPYAKRNERRVGVNRPKISHLPTDADRRSRKDRQREKQAVADERRRIKKAARQELKRKLRDAHAEEVD
jgi:F0F1-type ATP synthase membrane subunit b/b'